MNGKGTFGVLAVATAALLGGCAKPLKVEADRNAAPIRVAVLDVTYRDRAPSGKFSSEHLTEALYRSIEERLSDASDRRVKLSRGRAPGAGVAEARNEPDATHLIRVSAAVVAYSRKRPDYWDPCVYQNKNNECVGSMVGGNTDSATARVDASVIELASGREVFRVDPLESKPVAIGDDTPMTAARPLAKQLGKLLEDSGLLRR